MSFFVKIWRFLVYGAPCEFSPTPTFPHILPLYVYKRDVIGNMAIAIYGALPNKQFKPFTGCLPLLLASQEWFKFDRPLNLNYDVNRWKNV